MGRVKGTFPEQRILGRIERDRKDRDDRVGGRTGAVRFVCSHRVLVADDVACVSLKGEGKRKEFTLTLREILALGRRRQLKIAKDDCLGVIYGKQSQ